MNTNKKSINFSTLINSILLSLTPIIACLISTLIDGKKLSDVSILSSNWNDEIFYFHQVASCIDGFIPKGFFGYNESQSLYLSFGAWNPAILLPWLTWSKLFGWHYISPIISNIVIVSIFLLILGLLSKIDLKCTFLLSALLIIFKPFSRYLLSCMPDMIIVACLLVVVGLYISYAQVSSKRKIVIMYILIMLTTLMRPYLIMLYLLPLYLTIKSQKKRGFIPCLVCGFTVVLYYVTTKYFTAPYFGDVFSIDWLRYFINDGIKIGITQTILLLKTQWDVLWFMLFNNMPGSYASCTYYRLFFILFFLCLIELVMYIIKKNWDYAYLLLSICLMHIAIIGAILLMYNLYDGSKHLLLFIIIDLFVLSIIGYSYLFHALIIILFCCYSYWGLNGHIEELSTPYKNNEYSNIINYSNELHARGMAIEKSLSWNNDVIVVYTDFLKDDPKQNESELRWQYAYAIPPGFALNYCTRSHIENNISLLKSKYIMVMTNGSVESKLIQAKANLIFGDSNVSIYSLR